MSSDKDTGVAWLKKHADTLVILGAFALAFWTLNEKMNDRFNALEKDVAIIKTVLIMKNIIPPELANKEGE
jgi:hypothetical protein